MNASRPHYRDALSDARRIVVKVGTRVLVQRNGRPDRRRITSIARQVAALRREGRETVLVSSGAIGAGMEALGIKRRPHALAELQMAAAVGQARLMAIYAEEFARRGVTAAQVLLTHADLRDRTRHLNARNTMMSLLRNEIVPVVNENDVVAVEEIRFGDNDQLAALVSMLIGADLLVLLTSTDGLRAPASAGRTRRVRHLARVDEKAYALVWGEVPVGGLSIGGMASKLGAAGSAAGAGASVVIARGRRNGVLEDIVAGADTGTLIGQPGEDPARIPSKKRWIGFFHRAQGRLVIDAGASSALRAGRASLLPIGIRDVHGRFSVGAVVNVDSVDGSRVARGLVSYSSDEIGRIKGHHSTKIASLIGHASHAAVIHRDNLVVL